MKSGKVICFRCHKIIEEKSDYYAFSEYKKDVFVRTDYAHKDCWEDFLKKLGDTTEAMSIIRQLKGKLTTMGVLDPEEVYIK
jgi:hypothetical protein